MTGTGSPHPSEKAGLRAIADFSDSGHGARVDVDQVLSKGTPVADIILSYAADHGMDLIVIGAYSHARLVEMVFGGVTRTLLRQTPIPILLSR